MFRDSEIFLKLRPRSSRKRPVGYKFQSARNRKENYSKVHKSTEQPTGLNWVSESHKHASCVYWLRVTKYSWLIPNFFSFFLFFLFSLCFRRWPVSRCVHERDSCLVKGWLPDGMPKVCQPKTVSACLCPVELATLRERERVPEKENSNRFNWQYLPF